MNQEPTSSAFHGATCSPSLSCTPETDELMHRYTTWEGGKVQPSEIFRLASRLERERDAWKSRFADAVKRLEVKLHCADDCKCSGRQEVKRLRKILLENNQPNKQKVHPPNNNQNYD